MTFCDSSFTLALLVPGDVFHRTCETGFRSGFRERAGASLLAAGNISRQTATSGSGRHRRTIVPSGSCRNGVKALADLRPHRREIPARRHHETTTDVAPAFPDRADRAFFGGVDPVEKVPALVLHRENPPVLEPAHGFGAGRRSPCTGGCVSRSPPSDGRRGTGFWAFWGSHFGGHFGGQVT